MSLVEVVHDPNSPAHKHEHNKRRKDKGDEVPARFLFSTQVQKADELDDELGESKSD
jgi:hypothetical protein